ncbi:serine/threonine-protein kinase ppk6 [Niveomyces insectorum RCEF 264]|uniref:Serine/threonine-protein kinase ppk6 n=1 Tax=Niveomyces insectorum RCEF 264 TaxID=1081102 RepID=A0A167RGH4_9HYPO|nr:serine/threonine-protein kinase ppk6 [Niveomyces insectorum RCEF 264]
MSADLFAQFGSFSESNPPSAQPAGQQPSQESSGNGVGGQPHSDDPFAFLGVALSQNPAQPPPASIVGTVATGNWGDNASGVRPSGTVAAAAAASFPPTAGQDGDDDDDDAWGDFEASSPSAPTPVQTASIPPLPSLASAPQPPPLPEPGPEPQTKTRVVRAPTIDLMTNTLINFGDSVPGAGAGLPQPASTAFPHSSPYRASQATQTQTLPAVKKPKDPNVLFDAENYDEDEGSSDDDNDDDEGFGDFVTGQASPSQVDVAGQREPSVPPTVNAAQPTATPAAATALIDLLSLSDPEPAAPPSALSAIPVPSQRSNTALSSASRKQPPAQLLSPLSFGSASASYPAGPKSPSFQDRNPFPGLAVTTPLSAEFPKDKVDNRTPSPVTVWPTFDPASASSLDEKKGQAAQPPADDWDTWEAADAGAPPPANDRSEKNRNPKKTAVASEWDWDADDAQPATAPAVLPAAVVKATTTKAKPIPDNAPPPTNVPPPSILLSVFPELIALPDEALFKPTAGQPAEIRNKILEDPKTITFLRNYLQLVVVAARVVAGRKQRWHRDRFLMQSMSISAAGSSKGGGMKLAGLDKAQGQREDREAADVVAAWARLVGKLRSAVATANAALVAAEARDHKHYPPLSLPELQSATIPVTTAKGVPTAPRPCVVCGLRRDERVRGVDGPDVPDVFGEWWVEHWGHRTCRNFWVEHEATLRSR